MKNAAFLLAIIIFCSSKIVYSQDSIRNDRNEYFSKTKPSTFILPAAGITYGFLTLQNKTLQKINSKILNQVRPQDPLKKCHIDDYLQFTPGAIVFGLNAAGVHGVHQPKDAAYLYVLSNVIMNAIVFPTKHFSHELRPDNSAYSSFPSGHTSEAFASAEFLRMEYKNRSPLYGILGYAMAGMTGYLRMYNNKHWFSDIVAGAGVGIISTQLAYCILNKILTEKYKVAASKKMKSNINTPVF